MIGMRGSVNLKNRKQDVLLTNVVRPMSEANMQSHSLAHLSRPYVSAHHRLFSAVRRGILTVLGLLLSAGVTHASIYQWQWVDPGNHTLGKMASTTPCPGGAGVSAVPSANLSTRNLTQAFLNSVNLSNANLTSTTLSDATLVSANLTGATLSSATLTGADLSAATVAQAKFDHSNLTAAQLYSTQSYSNKDLHGIKLWSNNLTGWDLSNQNLTAASLGSNSILTGANFSGANLTNASFDYTSSLTGAVFTNATITGAGFWRAHPTATQIYSTTNYQAHNLQGILFGDNNLSGWNFVDQNLTGTDLRGCDFTGANLTGATIAEGRFGSANITAAQVYSTGSYSAGNLRGIGFPHDVSGWNFARKDLTHASFQFCDISNTDFTGATVTSALFDYTNLTSAQLYSTASYAAHDLNGVCIRDLDLRGWNFANQNLAGALFQGSRLTGSNLQNANLQSAWMVDLTMTGANLTGANLSGADFSRSDLRGVVGASLSSAITHSAILPDGTIKGSNWEKGLGVTFQNCSQDIPVRVTDKWLLDDVWLYFRLDDQPWKSTITFQPGINVSLAGDLLLGLDDGIAPIDMAGRTIKLFDWRGVSPTGAFSMIDDDVNGTDYYTLDTSHLYTTGEITFVSRVPEPSTFVLLASFALSLLVYRRYRSNKNR